MNIRNKHKIKTKRIKPRDWYYVEADKPWLNVSGSAYLITHSPATLLGTCV